MKPASSAGSRQPGSAAPVEPTLARHLQLVPTADKSSWLHSPVTDSVAILSAPFLAVALVFLFRGGLSSDTTPLYAWSWFITVVCIDVAHVYSTLFRTYLNPAEFRERRRLFIAVPLACWLASTYLALQHKLWLVIAYSAAFHFVRQQYGFMMLYSRKESSEQRRFKGAHLFHHGLPHSLLARPSQKLQLVLGRASDQRASRNLGAHRARGLRRDHGALPRKRALLQLLQQRPRA